jgi:hypothetical protein
MKNKIFNLYGQSDKKWLLKYGFWRLIYFALLAKFWVITTNKYPINGNYFSIGTSVPIDELWGNGYEVCLSGYVLFEPVLFYEKIEQSEPSLSEDEIIAKNGKF